jgi:hypothetical protein
MPLRKRITIRAGRPLEETSTRPARGRGRIARGHEMDLTLDEEAKMARPEPGRDPA